MSHVTTQECDIQDLDALAKAASLFGCELVKQPTYKWWGKWVNDYDKTDAAYKHGIKPEDYGKCEYALRVIGDPEAYEVGIVRRPDGNPGWVPVWDFYGDKGRRLQAAIGDKGITLRQEYAMQVGMKRMAREGWRVERRINPATNRPQMRAWGK